MALSIDNLEDNDIGDTLCDSDRDNPLLAGGKVRQNSTSRRARALNSDVKVTDAQFEMEDDDEDDDDDW